MWGRKEGEPQGGNWEPNVGVMGKGWWGEYGMGGGGGRVGQPVTTTMKWGTANTVGSKAGHVGTAITVVIHWVGFGSKQEQREAHNNGQGNWWGMSKGNAMVVNG